MRKSFLALILVVCFGLFLTACNNNIIQKPNGNQESNNEDSYNEELSDVYLTYVSTVGETYAMSYEDWLASIKGEQGPQGNDGLSAFEIFKKHYPEYIGTEEEWIYAVATNGVCSLFGHNIVIDKAVQATCTTSGLTEGSHCNVCGKVFVEQKAIGASHNYIGNICSECGFNCETNGITFQLSQDGESYSITNYKGTDTNLIIPSTYNGKPITNIAFGAFSRSETLKTVEIPDSVISIDYAAFGTCRLLTSVTIGSGLESIGNTAFHSCDSLKSIIVSDKNRVFDSRNNCNAIIQKSNNKLVIGCANTSIPDTVEIIGDFAFGKCMSLISIEIPQSVTRIDFEAFADCDNLTTVYYAGSKNQWNQIDINNGIGANQWLLDATLICTGSDESGFIYESNGDGFSSIVGMATVITMPEEAPNGETIIRIAGFAFRDLQNIIVEIPSTIQVIEDYAFYDCDIKEIRYSGSVEEWNNIIKNDGWWNANCSGFSVFCSDGEITY